MGSGKVVLAHVHPPEVGVNFAHSILGVTLNDLKGAGRLLDTGGTFGLAAAYAGPAQIAQARNELVERFLELHGEAEWLWFLDSDMGVDGAALEMLIASADPERRPVVGGLCFAQKVAGVGESHAFRSHFLPTIYLWTENEDKHGFDPVYEYPRNALVQCAGTGGACLLIHRDVLERIRAEHGNNWFEPIYYRDRLYSEDLSFCLRLIQLKIPLYVNTAVKTSHQKTMWVDESLYDLLRRNSGDRPVHVVIPVKDQLEMTRRLVHQIDEEGRAASILLVDNGSGPEMAQWLGGQHAAEVVSCPDSNIHEMWNLGIRRALEQDPDADVVILNNDLRVGPEFVRRLTDALWTDPHLLATSANYDGRAHTENVIPVRGVCAGRYDGTGGFAGFAFALRNDFITGEDGYRFPEQLEWWYGDNDLLATIEQRGGWYGIVRDAHVEHLDGGSVTARELDQDEYAAQTEKDRAWFLEKWDVGGDDADNSEQPQPAA